MSNDPKKMIAELIEGEAAEQEQAPENVPQYNPLIVSECALLDHSDTDNSIRLIKHFGNDLSVMAQSGVSGGDWLGWTGTHWDIDSGQALAIIAAKKVGDLIKHERDFIEYTKKEMEDINAAKSLSDDETKLSDTEKEIKIAAMLAKKARADRRATRLKFAISSKNKSRIEAMLSLAAPMLRRAPDLFDTDPFLVATKSHTLRFDREVDLECPDENTIRYKYLLNASLAHNKSDYLTALVPVNYDPEAKCPRWEAFLNKMLPSEGKRKTVQQFTGMGLTGVLPQYVMFHYGLGANGKSVFLETITRLLGESFAVGLPRESVVGNGERNVGGASPDLARLFGKRMVRVLEVKGDAPLQEDFIKRLTGGEKIAVRTLFKGFFEFQPKAKPHMSGNGFPTIDGTDDGIWRRLIVVHWDQTIPVDERRELEDIVTEFINEESSGILNWMIKGALDYLTNGRLEIADDVLEKTAAYREEMDPIGEFIRDCVTIHPLPPGAAPGDTGYSVQARLMYKSYVAWSQAAAKRARTETKFGRTLAQKFNRQDSRERKWLDVSLHDVPQSEQEPRTPHEYG